MLANQASLEVAIDSTTRNIDKPEAIRYVKGVDFKLRAAYIDLKDLECTVVKFCLQEERDEFYFRKELEQFVTSLRSALDSLAQLINLLCGLGLPRRRSEGLNAVTFISLARSNNLQTVLPALARYLKSVADSPWFDYFNDLRIETVHVCSVPIAKERTATVGARFILASPNATAEKTEASTGAVTVSNTETAPNPTDSTPPAPGMLTIENLLLPDSPDGHKFQQHVELISYCEGVLSNVSAALDFAYTLLISWL